MALVVEDGTGVPGADSYNSAAEADTYFADHGSPPEWTSATEPEKESALRYSALWQDARYPWPGVVLKADQGLLFPRSDAYDCEGRLLEGVPEAIKRGQLEAARLHLQSPLFESLQRGGEVKREKVGPIEVEYQDSAPGGRTYGFIDSILSCITRYSPGIGRLVRA